MLKRALDGSVYLDAVRLCVARQARQRQVDISWSAELEQEAVKWPRDKSKRCGRR